MEELENLRLKISEITFEILRLVKKRLELAREIGKIKSLKGIPIRNENAEMRILYQVQKVCEDLEIYPELGEELTKLLIKYSVKIQEENE
ncbi:MAG: chorismate mutase [Candidatus Jordarchaeum sp.]|uniref:chorismate mutase n=1 Tax=Candidatus Jordarchaeum sp. TaxID=2823881 RepID=UPI00404B6708